MSYKLETAVWELTLGCNMNCKHCGSSAGQARKDELTTEECYTLCEDLAELSCNVVCLMGGEPFLRKDWFNVANCIRDLGMEVSFVTNGLLMEEVIENLAEVEPLVVGVSLDGLEKTHDSIRREGSFKAAIKALDLLRENDIQTTVITTLSKTNFNELRQLGEIVINKSTNWQIQVGAPFGNFDPKLAIDFEEYYASAMFIIEQQIANRKFGYLPVVGAHCYGYYSHLLHTGHKWKGCTAGISTIGITSNGGIVGCLSISNKDFIEGNVRERSLVDIWNDENSFAYNRHFTAKDLGPNCQNCYYSEVCKGGCNSMSYHFTGQFHNDPYCMRRIEEEILEVKIPRKECKKQLLEA
ncbi:MAG: radical SAM protein [Candidatus Heimdallarchaeaceae archaeon]